MPASTGLSSCSTVRPILPRPSARSVPRCGRLWPIWLRVCVIRTFATLLLSLSGGTSRFLRSPLHWSAGGGGRVRRRLCRLVYHRTLVRKNLRDRLAADPGDVLGTAQVAQPVHGRLGHVDRVRRAEALREDAADPGEFQHRAHAAAGDDTGPLARRSQQDAGRVCAAEDLVRDRRAVLGDGEEVLLRVLDGLRDRQRHLARFPVADADAVDLVADYDERGEREPPAALHHLGDAVDLDHALLQLARLLARDHLTFNRCETAAQNLSPPSRAASASALTRPWYR